MQHILHSASRGLKTIHDCNCIHGDIKSHNLLINKDIATSKYSCAWGDLGGAIFLTDTQEKTNIEQGTSGWTAPEIFTGGGYNLSADIFSFGMVMCDASSIGGFTNKLIGLENDKYVEAVKMGHMPGLHHDGTGIAELIEYCWRLNPRKRPSADQVERRLAGETP